jgi:hypothetical protein
VGGIGAEHVDALAAGTSRLDDVIKAALLGQDDLLEAARSQTPEQFGQTVRDRARTLEADHGIERNKQQRRQTFLSHKVNHETGMHEGRFAFHPELGSRIFSAITGREPSALLNRQLAAERLHGGTLLCKRWLPNTPQRKSSENSVPSQIVRVRGAGAQSARNGNERASAAQQSGNLAGTTTDDEGPWWHRARPRWAWRTRRT